MTDDAALPQQSFHASSSGSGNNDDAELKEKLLKVTDLAARAQADLLNFKDRMKKQEEELRKFAVVPLLLELLPIRDDLARASLHGEEAGTGLPQILAKIDAVLDRSGMEKIPALGKKADPSLHEIVNEGPGKKDVVTLVHQEGYQLHGKILRPSKVQVGNGNAVS